MPEPIQAAYAAIYGPAQVRLAELGAELLRLEGEGLDPRRTENKLLALSFGLEELAGATDPAASAELLARLIEDFGLLAVGTDPLLRPLLPPIPASGAVVHPFYLTTRVNGVPKALLAGGRLLFAGAHLVFPPS